MAGGEIGEYFALGDRRFGIGQRLLHARLEDRVERCLLTLERAQAGADDLAERAITAGFDATARHCSEWAEGDGDGFGGAGGHVRGI